MDAPGGRYDSLAVRWPSGMLLVRYPFFAVNVRILCEEEWSSSRGSSSLATLITSLDLIYKTEGAQGLFRGGYLYVLHEVLSKGVFRYVADRCLRVAETKEQDFLLENAADREVHCSVQVRSRQSWRSWIARSFGPQSCQWKRVFMKYAINALCYPILLASTRIIVLHCDDPRELVGHVNNWCREEGLLCLFKGLSCSLLSTALDEIMESVVISAGLERSAPEEGSVEELLNKFVLQDAVSSLVSICSAPVSHVGTIQRCQSPLPHLLAVESLSATVRSLPWKSFAQQLFMFPAGILMNVMLIQWLQGEVDTTEEPRATDGQAPPAASDSVDLTE